MNLVADDDLLVIKQKGKCVFVESMSYPIQKFRLGFVTRSLLLLKGFSEGVCGPLFLAAFGMYFYLLHYLLIHLAPSILSGSGSSDNSGAHFSTPTCSKSLTPGV